MKTNLPVTQTERFLEPGKPIVTKTDLKGCITYANDSFVTISGFSREELIGVNHNVVRHPDMPVEAFADLWRIVKTGQPWRGLVKNRAKSGDFYWVEAFVTPITENGSIVGYMSVRNAPSRTAVAEAESLYRSVKGGAKFPATPLASQARSPAVIAGGVATAAALLTICGSFFSSPVPQISSVLGSGLFAALAAWLIVQFSAPLRDIGNAIRNLDEGLLAKEVEGGSTYTKSLFSQLEAMRIHLRAMFADVLIAARTVDERTQQLDDAMQAMKHSSSQQSERVMQIAASMEQMSVSINEISSNTDLSLKAVRDTEHAAQASMSTVGDNIMSSEKVVLTVRQSQAKILEVNQAIEKVGCVTRVIKEIAEQTNLLALNAAIEAARAGEQGRGFSVVADEVRKLAERTAASTKEIADVVDAIVDHSKAAVSIMEAASQDVVQSSTKISESRKSLAEILDASHSAAHVAGEITDMLKQQSIASHDVANNMEMISAAVEASHESVEQVGRSAAELRGTGAELRSLVKHLESALG